WTTSTWTTPPPRPSARRRAARCWRCSTASGATRPACTAGAARAAPYWTTRAPAWPASSAPRPARSSSRAPAP
ncbi:MAG: Cysteine desulfurase, partial [uncultured Gemmatimonadetes bacterium]